MSRGVGFALAAALACGGLAIWLSQPPAFSARGAPESLGQPFRPELPAAIRVLRVRLQNGADSIGAPPRVIRIDGPYRITELGHWRVLAQGGKLPATEIAIERAANANSAEPQIRIGEQRFEPRRLAIEVIQDGTLYVGDYRYRGGLHLLAEDDVTLTLVNTVPLESYLASVLPSEMPASFPEAAQQAQAIAARTYALYQLKSTPAGRGYDLDDSTASQRYQGMEYVDRRGRRLAAESAASRQIVEQTRGLALVYRGRLFCTYYSAVCGGHTTSGPDVFNDAAPPLAGVKCEHCSAATNYRWELRVPASEVTAKLDAYLAASGRQLGALSAIRIDDPGGGLIPLVEMIGAAGKHTFSAGEFRRRISTAWPSPLLVSAELAGDQVIVRGRGWGHGVGFCQHGARSLGQQGRTCSEILSYYYPGSQLAVVR